MTRPRYESWYWVQVTDAGPVMRACEVAFQPTILLIRAKARQRPCRFTRLRGDDWFLAIHARTEREAADKYLVAVEREMDGAKAVLAVAYKKLQAAQVLRGSYGYSGE